MDILTTQVGQNFAAGNLAVNELKPESDKEQASGSVVDQQSQKITAPTSEDIQANQDSADNSNREGQSRDIESAVQEIQTFLQAQNRNLAFSVDEGTNRSVVTVKESASGDVIRQIPSDEVLRLAERIQDLQQDIGSSVGVLFNKQV